MSFEENKLPEFDRRISDLPDQPNMQPNELKAYFDANPELLRQALGALCDALGAQTAAGSLGFSPTVGVPADTVQGAIENVQEQLDAAVMGNIPSGSVTSDKLAQDVRDRFSAIETVAAGEASARASADSAEASTRSAADGNLQNQIDSHTGQINSLSTGKCEIYCGTYTGNGAAQQDINLGFSPKAVFVLYNGWMLGNYDPHGGIALAGHPLIKQNVTALSVTSTGFSVLNRQEGAVTNSTNDPYFYLALK